MPLGNSIRILHVRDEFLLGSGGIDKVDSHYMKCLVVSWCNIGPPTTYLYSSRSYKVLKELVLKVQEVGLAPLILVQ